MRALVTGATGFIGSWLTRRLLHEGMQVAILARASSDLWRLDPLTSRFQCITADLQNICPAADAIRTFAPDVVFHLAWTGGNSAKFNDDIAQVYANVPGSLELLRLASEAGAKVFINLGSCVEYGHFRIPVRETDPVEPTTLYGAAKHAVEDLTLRMAPQLGLRVASVRVFWAYGPGDDGARLIPSLTQKLLAGVRHSMTPATQLWDYTYITDVVDALFRLAHTPEASGVFNLGSGNPRPLREIAEQLRELTGSAAEIGFGEIPFSATQIMHLEADISRLKQVTGWRPQTTLAEGLRRTVAWHRQSDRTLPPFDLVR
jgi:UDP-glucose 4-epimerase